MRTGYFVRAHTRPHRACRIFLVPSFLRTFADFVELIFAATARGFCQCDRGSFIHFGRPTHSGVPKVIRTQDMASLLRKTHSHSIPSDRSVADGVPELSKVASEKRASKERLSSATPTTDFKEKLRDMLINTGALTTLLFTMVTHGPNDLYNTSAAGAHPSC